MPARASQTHQQSQCRTPPRHEGRTNIRGFSSKVGWASSAHASPASGNTSGSLASVGGSPTLHTNALCMCKHRSSEAHTHHPKPGSQTCPQPRPRRATQPPHTPHSEYSRTEPLRTQAPPIAPQMSTARSSAPPGHKHSHLPPRRTHTTLKYNSAHSSLPQRGGQGNGVAILAQPLLYHLCELDARAAAAPITAAMPLHLLQAPLIAYSHRIALAARGTHSACRELGGATTACAPFAASLVSCCRSRSTAHTRTLGASKMSSRKLIAISCTISGTYRIRRVMGTA